MQNFIEVSLIVLAFATIFMAPALLVWGLAMIGLPVSLSVKSYFGAAFVLSAVWMVQPKSS